MALNGEENPAQLSETELRQLYDEEEVDRFLRFFSTYVTEVRIPNSSSEATGGPQDGAEPSRLGSGNVEEQVNTDTTHSLSERIAINFIAPLIPPPPIRPHPSFTLSRLHLTIQRLYLSLESVYYPFLVNIINLATWADRGRSLKYCLIFWILWWYNVLLPSLLLRILYPLVRRRIFAHPTYAELLERRRQAERAEEVGNDLTALLTPSSNVTDTWDLCKYLLSLAKQNFRSRKAKTADTDSTVDEGTTAVDDIEDKKGPEDVMKSDTLHVLNQIADFHERVKNIFIWRRPASSRHYVTLLSLLALVTYLTPAQYLSKCAYFCFGFSFWHITPILAALPSGSLAMIPPPLASVPTDAEYAMQLISKRMVNGGTLAPPKPEKPVNTTGRATGEAQAEDQGSPDVSTRSQPTSDPVNWSKWGSRVAAGKSWASQKKQLIAGNEAASSSTRNAVVGQSHAYPAQCRSSTGLLTVTSNLLYFTPALSANASVEIPMHALRSVKKSDLLKLKGLKIRWVDAASNNVEKEEQFIWVGGRDELFARLVGYGEGRWLKV